MRAPAEDTIGATKRLDRATKILREQAWLTQTDSILIFNNGTELATTDFIMLRRSSRSAREAT